MKKNITKTILLMMITIIPMMSIPMTILSCQTKKEITRTSADTVTDLSGRWNDTDSRVVAEAMIKDMLNAAWIDNFIADTGKKPVIIAGYVKNRSSEHIEVSGIISDIEKAVINSGEATVVASSAQRSQIRDERDSQQEESSFDTIKRLGEETGADYMLIGNIISQTDAAGKTTAVTYQVSLELIHIESTQKVWVGDHKIKKIIEQ